MGRVGQVQPKPKLDSGQNFENLLPAPNLTN